jgi:hypothetical protein
MRASKQPFPLLITKRSQQSFNHNPKRKEDTKGTTPNNSSTSIPSYLILIQHSFSLQHRIPNYNYSYGYSHSSSTTTSNVINKASKDIEAESSTTTCGLLFIRDSFDRISESYNGSFILLSLAGNLGYYCYDRENNNNNSNNSKTQLPSFIDHGVTVDASTDPLGWDSTTTTNATSHNNNKQHPKSKRNIINSRLDNLNELIQSMDQAVSIIIEQRNNRQRDESCNSQIMHDNIDNIPIVIDSITPLLIYHGVPRTMKFLHKLRQWHLSYNNHDDTNTNNHCYSTTMLSPIIVPILKESVLPEHHRILEDSVADAVVSIDGTRATIIRKSMMSGKVSKEEQLFSIGSSTSSTPHTLRFHDNEEDHKHNNGVSLSLIDNVATAGTNEDVGRSNPTTVAIPFNKSRSSSTAKEEDPWKKEMVSGKGKGMVLLHEDDMPQQPNLANPTQQQPRIFMQHDDIEFHDFDEDEPDDDLDL